MRINARLDDSFEEKFQYVQQTENKNRSMVVKEALEQYFAVKLSDSEQAAQSRNQEILKRIAGIASGDKDLSENYKNQMYNDLKDKYGID